MKTHVCAAFGCIREVPSHLLMCYPHWGQVPRAAQAAINRTWRAYMQANSFTRVERWKAYVMAREAAIQSVNPAPSQAPTGATP